MKRLLTWVIVGLIAVCAASYAVMVMPLPFVPSWWATDDYMDAFHRRHRMADAMVLSRTLIGQNREEIEARLGPPPPTDKYGDWDLVYPLGAERAFFAMDTEWLVIRFDASGAASEVRVVTD